MLIKKIQPYAILVMSIGIAILAADAIYERFASPEFPEVAMAAVSSDADASISCGRRGRTSCTPVVVLQPY